MAVGSWREVEPAHTAAIARLRDSRSAARRGKTTSNSSKAKTSGAAPLKNRLRTRFKISAEGLLLATLAMLFDLGFHQFFSGTNFS